MRYRISPCWTHLMSDSTAGKYGFQNTVTIASLLRYYFLSRSRSHDGSRDASTVFYLACSHAGSCDVTRGRKPSGGGTTWFRPRGYKCGAAPDRSISRLHQSRHSGRTRSSLAGCSRLPDTGRTRFPVNSCDRAYSVFSTLLRRAFSAS